MEWNTYSINFFSNTKEIIWQKLSLTLSSFFRIYFSINNGMLSLLSIRIIFRYFQNTKNNDFFSPSWWGLLIKFIVESTMNMRVKNTIWLSILEEYLKIFLSILALFYLKNYWIFREHHKYVLPPLTWIVSLTINLISGTHSYVRGRSTHLWYSGSIQ